MSHPPKRVCLSFISCAWIAHALGRRVRYDARGSDARGGDARSQSVGIPSRTADSIAGAPSAIPTPGKRTRGREFTLPDDVLVLQRHVRDGVRLTEIELPGREDKPNAARSRHNKHLQKLPGYVTYVNWVQSVNAPVANLGAVAGGVPER